MTASWDAIRTTLAARRARSPLARTDGPPWPASPIQQRLWQRGGDDGAARQAVACRLRGPLDVARLDASVRQVIARHASLRTVLRMQDRALVQDVALPPPALESCAVTDLPAWIAAEAAAPFDLARGPLFRAALARLDAHDHCLLLVAHDAVFDSWSFEILIDELAATYHDVAPGEPPLPYGDHAAWQQAAPADAAHERYWRDVVRDLPPVAERSRRAASSRTVFPAALSAQLRAVAARESTTLFVVLLAGVQALLHARTGARQVVVGSRFSLRTQLEARAMIGPLTRELPLRVDFSDQPAPREVIARARQATASAIVHQDFPIETLDVPRRATFAFHNLPAASAAWPGLELHDVPRGAIDVDLALTMQDRPDGLHALVEYDADRYTAADLAQLLDALGAVLAGLASDSMPTLVSAHTAPRDALERDIAAAFGRVLHRPAVGRHDSLFALGGDSMAAVRLAIELEALAGARLPLAAVFDHPTVARLADVLRARSAPALRPELIVDIIDGRPEHPLFLVGGGRADRYNLALYAKLLARARSADAAYGLLAPPGVETVAQIAAEHIAVIRSIQPEGPYAISGECAGGLVAYEIAQQLCAAGHELSLLLLIDTWCPTAPGLIYQRWIADPIHYGRAGLVFLAGLPRRAASDESWLAELWRRGFPTPDEERFMRACGRYRPGRYPGRVAILGSDANLDRGWAAPWTRLARGGVTIYRVPGGRQTFAREHLAATATQLRRCFDHAGL